ncbi:hypothetical protein AB0J84_14065 [Micromonospora arborensis]
MTGDEADTPDSAATSAADSALIAPDTDRVSDSKPTEVGTPVRVG